MGQIMLYPISKSRTPLACFLLLAATANYGQLLTTNLQGNWVNGIACEDATGYLLFATSSGLWKFDGKDFATLFFENFEDVAIDRDKRIWLGSKTNGLYIKNGSTWEHITSASGAPSNKITDLFVDSAGKIWVSTSDRGVGVFDGQLWHRLQRNQYEVFENGAWVRKAEFSSSIGPSDNSINVVYEDNDKGIWIGSRDGARRFSGALDSLSVVQINNWCSCLDGMSVLSFINGPDGRIWAGTEGHGVFLIPSGCRIRCATPDTIPVMENPLNKKIIHDVKLDLEGNLWFGTTEGVCRYNPAARSFRCLNENAYPGLRIAKTVFTDRDNNLWFGMSEDQGVIRLNNNWLVFSSESLPNLFVYSLLAVQDTLWVGTANGIRRFKGEARLGADILSSSGTITALAPAENSQVWIGIYGDGVYLYDGQGRQRFHLDLDPLGNMPCNNQVNQIVERNKELWIATDGRLSRLLSDRAVKHYEDSLRCFATAADKFNAIAFDKAGKLWAGTSLGAKVLDPDSEQWLATFTTANGLFEDNFVTAIAVDPKNGDIWVGTASGGISLYDGSTWQHLDRRTVLVDNAITEIVFSDAGEVFVATPRGVNRRDSNGIWCTFDSQSGLVSEYVVSIALHGDSLRWFGTYGAGLTRYHPPKSKPQTFIETRLDVTDKSEVTYRFSAADLNTAFNEFRYRYWLDNDAPSEPTSDRFASIKEIAPGPHTFYVQAIDRDGNLDPMPDTDFFTRIDPRAGGSSTKTDRSFRAVRPITVSVYWPPNLLKENTQINIDADTTAATALFAYRLSSSAAFNLRRPMTLTFAFPDTAVKGRNLGIFKIENNSKFILLGGTNPPQKENNRFSLSTAILDLGVYGVMERSANQAALSDSAQALFRVTAQPRILRGLDAQTTISFNLNKADHVRVQVYNLSGRLVGTIWNALMPSGINTVPWNGKDKNDNPCPPGLYLITLESNGFQSPPKPIKVMVMN
jgi:ligand-binding sensor domain-containing protein